MSLFKGAAGGRRPASGKSQRDGSLVDEWHPLLFRAKVSYHSDRNKISRGNFGESTVATKLSCLRHSISAGYRHFAVLSDELVLE
jgi:hypothetical protein